MKKEPRTESTSIRFTEKVGNIIDNAIGKSFSDKLEYIVLDYRDKKEEREAYLKYLNKQIVLREKQLKEIIIYLNKFSNISKEVNVIEESIQNLIEECNTKK
jgi:hypothetical protein